MHPHILLLLLLTLTTATPPPPPQLKPILPKDAVALLAFKSKADMNNNLPYTLTTNRWAHCEWQGVKCAQGRVVRLFLQSSNLLGLFPPQTLTHLDQLRVLSLSNNSLSGPIPDLSPLLNLRSLYLDHNHFSTHFPPSILSLHRLRILDFSHNNLSGFLPTDLTLLDRLIYLRLDSNRFTGALPPLNQTSLTIFNVSNNSFTGPIPVTPTLSRFPLSTFSSNPNLCGKFIDKICRNTTSPFFDSPDEPASPPSPFLQNAESQGAHLSPPSTKKQRKKTGIILGFVIGALILVAASLSIFAFLKNNNKKGEGKLCSERYDSDQQQPRLDSTSDTTSGMGFVASSETEAGKEKKISLAKLNNKSGNLIFCDGEMAFCSLEQLMRASAELLGRGTIGTTYKAVMDNELTVTVKRLDAGKTAVTTAEAFERHLEAVGVLRHPNLVAVRAYFQAKQERLIVYDYQPNGSLFNLIHGSRSTRAKPLHWTSCLKIAEDVALGLAYIHQASRLIHGNVKSSNILLGADFEACLTDYCLAILADSTWNDDLNSAAYKAPEMRKSSRRATTNSDVYAFGILLLELLTGKPPSQHPFLAPTDVADWVRAMREDDGGEDNRLDMLVEVAGFCSLTSPEQRPSMRQVVKMIQEIKENAMIEDNSREASNEYL